VNNHPVTYNQCYDIKSNKWTIEPPLPVPLCHLRTFPTYGGIGLAGALTYLDDSLLHPPAVTDPKSIPTLVYRPNSKTYSRLPWSLPVWPGWREWGSFITLDDATLIVYGHYSSTPTNVKWYSLNQHHGGGSSSSSSSPTWQPMNGPQCEAMFSSTGAVQLDRLTNGDTVDNRKLNIGPKCNVCLGEESKKDPMMTCHECHVNVHQRCYGSKQAKPAKIAKTHTTFVVNDNNTWKCDRCKVGESDHECILCSTSFGVMKQVLGVIATSDDNQKRSKWAHLSCAKEVTMLQPFAS
jgi:hypothetical protein